MDTVTSLLWRRRDEGGGDNNISPSETERGARRERWVVVGGFSLVDACRRQAQIKVWERAKEKCEDCSQRTVFCGTDCDVPLESLMKNYHCGGGAGTVFIEGVVLSLIAIIIIIIIVIIFNENCFLMDKFRMDY